MNFMLRGVIATSCAKQAALVLAGGFETLSTLRSSLSNSVIRRNYKYYFCREYRKEISQVVFSV